MSVAEQPVEPMPEALCPDAPLLDPQAALELAHELVLVTRATFAQLLPGTATRAVSGVPGLGGAAVTATPSPAPVMAQVSSVPAQSVATPPPAPAPPAAPTPAATSVSVPAITVPVETAAEELTSESEQTVITRDQPETSDVVTTPTISLSVPTPTVTVENPAGYVPVPGVETPAAASATPLVQPAPIAAPISLSVVEPTDDATPEPVTTGSEAGEPVEPVAPLRPFHPNLAMLEEISFLDE